MIHQISHFDRTKRLAYQALEELDRLARERQDETEPLDADGKPSPADGRTGPDSEPVGDGERLFYPFAYGTAAGDQWLRENGYSEKVCSAMQPPGGSCRDRVMTKEAYQDHDAHTDRLYPKSKILASLGDFLDAETADALSPEDIESMAGPRGKGYAIWARSPEGVGWLAKFAKDSEEFAKDTERGFP